MTPEKAQAPIGRVTNINWHFERTWFTWLHVQEPQLAMRVWEVGELQPSSYSSDRPTDHDWQ